ncbi:M67 family metallopeptidase [Telmatospirillum sp.]|uniref:M67 family metallopeptidase n=1 Tax=Telmatospirillum sp. TaxID=2079197 RepID=UPI00284A6801|nr:M67 family metallopeptidase [Telmatospirillum sp.]MDR3437936.1 M67 family metallopeptidase [Telmatospirillum sp.]
MDDLVAVLQIEEADFAALRRHAAESYPEECCGLLIGRRETDGVGPEPAPACGGVWRVTRVVPAANRAENRKRSFEVDPATHIALLRGLREASRTGATGPEELAESLLGPYHSHPDASSRPSTRDRAQAMEVDAVWLILGSTESGVTAADAWRTIRQPDGTIDFTPMELSVLSAEAMATPDEMP